MSFSNADTFSTIIGSNVSNNYNKKCIPSLPKYGACNKTLHGMGSPRLCTDLQTKALSVRSRKDSEYFDMSEIFNHTLM